MQQSDIDDVFHPERPVTKRGLLIGRDAEVELAIARLGTAGGHVLICGHRGIGKTSIARVVEAALSAKDPLFFAQYFSCDSKSTFQVIAEILALRARISLPPSLVGSPSIAADYLSSISGFLLLDEIDRLALTERTLLAEFMKALSDRAARFAVCVVGIARTANDIFEGHLSVHRCLNEIHVRQLPKSQIARLVDERFSLLRLKVRADIVIDIARLSQGFPSNAIAICRHCAEGLLQSSTTELGPELFRKGLRLLLKERGQAPSDVLLRVLRGDNLDEKRAILLGASSLEQEEFSDTDLLAAARRRTAVSDELFDALTLGLCIEGIEKVFDIIVPGLFRFSDPRMSMIVDITEYLRLEKSKANKGE